jgi:HD-like signal output (HDOD) protein
MYDTIILEYEGQFGHGRTVEEIASWVGTIPPIPEAANRALKLVDDPDSSPHEIAAVLARDPALVSALMRAANSAALGRSEAVNVLEEAVLVVGLGPLKSLLLGLTLKRWNAHFGPIEKLVWEKSLGTAAAAHVVTTFLEKADPDTARLCGLLHNLGQIIMLSQPQVRKDYPAVLKYIEEHGVDYAEAERVVIGFSHPLVGAMVAHRWQMPLSICNTILHYADPFEGLENKQDEQVALIKLSAQLSLCAGLGFPVGHPLVSNALEPVAQALGFEAETFAGYQDLLAKQTQALYAAESNLFN